MSSPVAGGVADRGDDGCPGSRDLTPDPGGRSTRLTAVGRAAAWTSSRLGPSNGAVGVRGATADGLPMAGPRGEPGLHLALAPRRNGWLLGPLVGRVVADGIEGRPR